MRRRLRRCAGARRSAGRSGTAPGRSWRARSRRRGSPRRASRSRAERALEVASAAARACRAPVVAHAQLLGSRARAPPARRGRSARACRGSTGVPYGMRDARQGSRPCPRSARRARAPARGRPPCGARLQQRVNDAVLGGRSQAGPPVAEVVGVRARQQRRVAALARERGERVVELGLAVVAAVAIVAAVALARELVRRDRLVGDADRRVRPRAHRRARPRQARGRPPSPRARAGRARGPRAPRPATSRRRPRTRRPRCRARPARARARLCSASIDRSCGSTCLGARRTRRPRPP